MSAWTQELYERWRQEWVLQRPGKQPPTWEEFRDLMDMFDFTPEQIGVEQ